MWQARGPLLAKCNCTEFGDGVFEVGEEEEECAPYPPPLPFRPLPYLPPLNGDVLPALALL